MEEFFVPDAKDREVATRMAPDGSTLPGANKVCTSEWRGGDNIEEQGEPTDVLDLDSTCTVVCCQSKVDLRRFICYINL